MSSGLRSRSVSRSRVTKTSDSVLSGEILDPAALLEDILGKIPDLDIPLGVHLRSGSESVSFSLSVFLASEYEVVEGVVSFGIKKLALKGLRAKISFEIEVTD